MYSNVFIIYELSSAYDSSATFETKLSYCPVARQSLPCKGLFTWSGGPRSSGVGFFCFHALWDIKQKKFTPLHVNRVLVSNVALLPC